jgi:predicted ATPase
MGNGKMLIKKIKVSNFKSFDELDIELGSFNVLIGANASGKSNFVYLFKFLNDVVKSGLDNAISMQGGVDYIRNINIGASENLSVELYIDSMDRPLKTFRFKKEGDKRSTDIYVNKLEYKFSIKFHKTTKGYKINEERLVAKCDFIEVKKRTDKIDGKKKIGEGEITLIRDNGRIKYELKSKDTSIKTADVIPPFFSKKGIFQEKISAKELFIEIPMFLLPLSIGVNDLFRTISIYDLDPKLPKKATPITGKTELDPDGRNLAIVLKNILDDKKKVERISSLIKDLLPFIEELTVERLADKSLLASLKEVYSEKAFLPASLMSDGTINITALIIILYFERKPLIIIEEPERTIHPHLISKIVDMMKDVSERFEKQIIVTTHNPEMVKYAGLDNILLVHRDDKGFSKISRPSEKEEVKIFLENEMSIEELYVQNLLEW